MTESANVSQDVEGSPGTAEPMIRLQGLTKRYRGQDVPAVDALDLAIPRGEIVVLVGPSGCGKTTTLKMINRLIEPTSGTIEIDGRDVTHAKVHELRRGIGYVIQQIGLLPHRTIRQNVATVPRLLGWEAGVIDDRVDELLDRMGLAADLADRYPSELSGGQRQRVGVARALAADPPVLLMDEPFGAVDPIVRGRLQDQLLVLQAELGKTIVLVTHDVDEAVLLGDRIAILDVGGELAQYDAPDAILAAPASPFVEDFLGGERSLRRLGLASIGELDLLRGTVVQASDDVGALQAAVGRSDEGWVVVLDGNRLLGWVDLDGVPPSGRAGDANIRPFITTVAADASLRSAVDAMLSSPHHVAVVVDAGVYLGVVTLGMTAGALS